MAEIGPVLEVGGESGGDGGVVRSGESASPPAEEGAPPLGVAGRVGLPVGGGARGGERDGGWQAW